MKNLLVLAVLTLSNSPENHKVVIERLSEKHQTCLDSGINMLGCSRKFYFEMDSMLNVVYKDYKSTLNEIEKENLKKEQRDWLKKRDDFLAKENKEYQKNIDTQKWGPDMYMIVYDNDANFVKKRIFELIDRMGK